MTHADPIADDQDRVLRELAELGLAFARDLAAQVAAVKTVAEADVLALAFHRATRSVRLAIALQVKIARDRHEVGRLDRALAVRRADARKDQIRAALSREIFTDTAEQEDADALAERLNERLDEDALFEAFLDGPVEDAIARIREDLGLTSSPPGGGGPRSGGGGFTPRVGGIGPSAGDAGGSLSQPAADSSPYGGASSSSPPGGGAPRSGGGGFTPSAWDVTPSVSFADSSP